jgi:SHS2 domain-containing protein
MEYEILEGITSADIAFRVRGQNVEELFFAGARSLLEIMLQDRDTVRPSMDVSFTCESKEIDLLYFDFLSELVYYKDSEKLLLLPERIALTSSPEGYTLACRMCGERIDRNRHLFTIDIKAVTLHNLIVKEDEEGWSATAVLDV